MWAKQIVNIVILLLTTQSVLAVENEKNLGIVNGKIADDNQFPHQVAILSYYDELDMITFCGGSLISNLTVLTAAQCLSLYYKKKHYEPSRVVLQLGCQRPICDWGQKYIIEDKSFIKVHLEWDAVTNTQDIGLVNLPYPTKLGKSVWPIKLDLSAHDHVNENATLSGWGYTKDIDWIDPSGPLKYVDLKVISNDECAKKIDTLISSQLCTAPTNDEGERVGFCFGDTGGALIAGGKQIGVASFYRGNCTDVENPPVYSRVSDFHRWIMENAFDFWE